MGDPRGAGELACTNHSDLLLCLDELKLVDPRHAGNLAYIIASGSGKQRMDKSLTAAPTLSWRVLALSSGEISLETHVTSASADGLYGGMHVRFVEVPEPTSEFGMFDRIPNEWGSQAGKFAEELTRRARRSYGAPIRAYLTEIVPHRDQYRKLASDLIQEFVRRAITDTPSSEVVNVAQRFGLATAGGVIAIRLKILDWNEDNYIEGQLAMFQQWRDTRGSDAPADEERAVRQVREILESDNSKSTPILDYNAHPIKTKSRLQPRRVATSRPTEITLKHYPEASRRAINLGSARR